MKFNKYFLFLVVFCLSHVNWVTKDILPRDVGSKWGSGMYRESFDIYRILPIISYMQIAFAQNLAKEIAKREDVKEIFEGLDESVFKNEIRRQYFLLRDGLYLDAVSISFSISELLSANFFDEKIKEAEMSGSLDLSNFKIGSLEGLSDLLGQIQNVISALDLSHNELTELWKVNFVNYLGRIQKLDLSYNKISYLEPRCFDNLNALQFLDLGHNQISDLPPYLFSQLYNLIGLDLSDNALRYLRDYMFFGLGKKLEKLNLADNPTRETVSRETVSKESLGLPNLIELIVK